MTDDARLHPSGPCLPEPRASRTVSGMRRPAWNGNPPADDQEARGLLVAAAVRSIEKHTLSGTSIASIAREAGVTRKTVYRYFESGEQIVTEAEIRAGGGILRGLREVASRFEAPTEKLIESMVYLYREIPRDPLLGPYFTGQSRRLVSDPHLTRLAVEVASKNLADVLGIDRPKKAQRRRLEELSELAIRLLASFLEHPGEDPRSDRQMRAFLYHWFAPSIERGLAGD
jgi:AcrR family transcriptional regulator